MSHYFKDLRIHALGLTQIINWGILFYTPALLSKPLAAKLNLSLIIIYSGFTISLIVGGLFAALAGRWLDKYGGRHVMSYGVILSSIALIFQALAFNLVTFYLASILMGLAMRLTLYEAAFSALVEIFGKNARPAISIVTLHGALASSFLWPITHFLNLNYGVTNTLLIFAVSIFIISLPLTYYFLPTFKAKESLEQKESAGLISEKDHKKATLLFSIGLVLTSFVFGSLAIHLITFMEGLAIPLTVAVWLASLKGFAQFGGRFVELLFGQKINPLAIALFATACVFVSFLFLGLQHTILYVIFYGIGQGLLTITRGAVPLVLFGSKGYGELIGKLMTPSLIISAFSPIIFGFYLDKMGATSGLYFLSIMSFIAIIPFILLYKITYATER